MLLFSGIRLKLNCVFIFDLLCLGKVMRKLFILNLNFTVKNVTGKFLLTCYFIILIFSLKSGVSQTYIHPYRWQVDSLIVKQQPQFIFHFPETHRPLWQSLQIYRNSQAQQAEIDYRFQTKERTIEFFPPLSDSDSLRIIYRRLPFNLRRQYVLFKKDTLRRHDKQDSLKTAESSVRLRQINFENPFTNLNTGLQTSGSIMRGVQIGTNRDLTLNSGLNLELSGKLTDNVEIAAALTDEATPIQPEGNTQTLEEVDKVFVQFRSPYVQGTVGDFNLKYDQSQFANLTRKLQGITLLGNYKSNFIGATIATTRGFFNHVSFIGQEGNQGPYQLIGKNGERDIIVLAGTERVWVNGKKMIRGESNDYVIEYGNGQITFTNKRLITSESRLEVDFEYFPAIQKYNRNVYSAAAGGLLADGKLKLNLRCYREADDPRQVLEEGGAVGDQEKDILKAAGDNPLNAYISGETYVGDSLGTYIKLDTVNSANDSVSYYKYAGKKQGNYSVTFFYVGKGKGDYIRDRLGVYYWKDKKAGDYMPIRLLPLPSTHDLADFQMEWRPSQNYNINAEFAVTRLDQNTFSSLDDGDNQGGALQLNAEMNNVPLQIKSINLGKLSLNLNTRYIENTFQAVDRFNQPDYQRYWNVLQQVQNENEELSLQIKGNYQPVTSLRLSGNAGRMDKSDFSSERYSGQIDFDKSKFFKSTAKYEYIGGKIEKSNIKNDWRRYYADIQKNIWKFQPQLMYDSEIRKNRFFNQLTGFKFDDLGGKLGLFQWRYLNGYAQFNRRFDYVYDYNTPGRLLHQAISNTKRLNLILQNYQETSASLLIIQRDKDYTSQFENIKIDTLKLLYADASVQDTVWQDRKTNLAELNLSHSHWKKALNFTLQYRISTEQTALKEKIYLDVGDGRGNLRYDEDLKEYIPDTDGKYILYILPSGKFEPVADLQSALRIRFDPGKYWRKPKNGFQNILSKLSGESYFRVEEKTKESDVRSIYLLNLSKFQKGQTIRGSIQFNQDLYIMRRNRKLSFRLRYRYRDSRFNQYLDPNENEDRLSTEKAVRADWRITPKIKSQSEVRQKITLRESKANTLRNRDITGYYYDQKFSYRPASRWEIGLESQYGLENNDVETYPLRLWYDALKGRINFSLPGKGRVSAQYEYQVVKPTENPLDLSIPYEMAQGKKEGVSKLWNVRAEYTVAKNILFTLFYSGRDEAHYEKIIHTGQAEIRAFF